MAMVFQRCVLLLILPVVRMEMEIQNKSRIVSMYQEHCGHSCHEGVEPSNDSNRCPLCSSCSCEDSCVLYGTCCPDFQTISPMLSTQCQPVSLMYSSGNQDTTKVHVVTECGHNSSNYVNACDSGRFEGHYDPRLVYIANGSDIVFFKNRYCAWCNGFFSEVSLQAQMQCVDTFDQSVLDTGVDMFEWLQDSLECSLVYRFSEEVSGIPECDFDSDYLISECNTTGLLETFDPDIEVACRILFNPFVSVRPNFRNIFCYLCNEQPIRCNILIRRGNPNFISNIGFVAILNFLSFGNQRPEPMRTERRCESNGFYDPIENICKELICPGHEILEVETCHFRFLLVEHVLYVVHVLLLPNITVNVTDGGSSFNAAVFIEIGRHLREVLPTMNMTLEGHETLLRPINHIDSDNFQFESIILKFHTRPSHILTIEEAKGIILNAEQYDFELQYNGSTIGFESSLIYGGDDLDVSDGTFYSFFGVSINPIIYGNEIVIELQPTSCPLVKYEQDVFKVDSNWRIHHIDSNTTFNRTEYMVNYTDLLLCAWSLDRLGGNGQSVRAGEQHFLASDEVDTSLDSPTIIILIVQISGLVCLFLTFLTYLIFKALRTLPGKNLMLLVLSLFFAHISLIIGFMYPLGARACRAIAPFVHFLWLSAFAWMSVCSFHVHKAFRVIAPSGQAANQDLLWKYCAFGFGAPFIAVVLVFVVNLGLSGGQETGYGPSRYVRVCFITNTTVSIITFAVPITINIVNNTFYLLSTCYSLRKASQARRSLHQKKMNICAHCCKLLTLTGLSWVVGFIATFSQEPVFVYIFVVLSAGQGIFIFLAFVTTKRVWELYRGLFTRLNETSNKTNPTVKTLA